MRFRATLVQTSGTSVGVVVPEELLLALSRNRRPKVQITVNGAAPWWTTLSVRPGGCFVRISAEQRPGTAVGDAVEVDVVLDAGPRGLPGDFALALSGSPRARAAFERMAPADQRAWIDWILGDKPPGRSIRAVAALEAGKRPF
jgi:hypothetical protein